MATTAAWAARVTKAILIVEDDPAVVRILKSALGMFQREHTFKIEVAEDGADALAALQRVRFDLVLLDLYMPRMCGLELLAHMRRLGMRIPVLLLTGNNDTRVAVAADALATGIFAYIPKPLDLLRLDHLVWLAMSLETSEVDQ